MQTVLVGILLVNICLVIQVTGLADFIPVMEEDFEYCTLDKKPSHVDLTEFHLVTGKDRIFANGTVKFLKDIKSPWKIDVTTQRLVNGKWQDGDFKKEYKDFCMEKNYPQDPVSAVVKSLGNCPIKAGHIATFNMIPTSQTPAMVPDSLRGEWRIYARTIYSDSNGKVEDCSTMAFEIMQK